MIAHIEGVIFPHLASQLLPDPVADLRAPLLVEPAAALNLAFFGWCLFILLLRGPHAPRYTWFGYAGGLEVRRSRLDAAEKAAEKEDEEAPREPSTDADREIEEKKAEGVEERSGDQDEETKRMSEKDPAEVV